MTKTAHFIRNVNDRQVLFEMTPPHEGYQYVVTSVPHAEVLYLIGPETFIFGADSEGNINEFLELEGSLYDEEDHFGAIANAGYEVIA